MKFTSILILTAALVIDGKAQVSDEPTLTKFYNTTIKSYYELSLDSITKAKYPTLFFVNDSLPAGIEKDFHSFQTEIVNISDTLEMTQIMSIYRIKRRVLQDTVDIIITQIWNRDKQKRIEVLFDLYKEKLFVKESKKFPKRNPDVRFIYNTESKLWTYKTKREILKENNKKYWEKIEKKNGW